MVFKLVNAAAKTWWRLKGENQCQRSFGPVAGLVGIEVA
jgi:hypothetical protein